MAITHQSWDQLHENDYNYDYTISGKSIMIAIIAKYVAECN